MGFMEGLAARSDLAAMQGHNSKAYRASFERPVPVAVNGGGFGMGAGAYSGYGISYAGGNASSRQAQEGSIYGLQIGRPGSQQENYWNWAKLLFGVVDGGIRLGTNAGGPAPRAGENSFLTQTPGYGRTDIYDPYNGSGFGGGFAMAGAPQFAMRGGAGSGVYAVADARARQMASLQGGGFAGGTQSDFLSINLGSNLWGTDDGTALNAEITKFNQEFGAGSVDIVDGPRGESVLVFKDNNAKRAFGDDPNVKRIVSKIRQGTSRVGSASTSSNRTTTLKDPNVVLDLIEDDIDQKLENKDLKALHKFIDDNKTKPLNRADMIKLRELSNKVLDTSNTSITVANKTKIREALIEAGIKPSHLNEVTTSTSTSTEASADKELKEVFEQIKVQVGESGSIPMSEAEQQILNELKKKTEDRSITAGDNLDTLLTNSNSLLTPEQMAQLKTKLDTAGIKKKS